MEGDRPTLLSRREDEDVRVGKIRPRIRSRSLKADHVLQAVGDHLLTQHLLVGTCADQLEVRLDAQLLEHGHRFNRIFLALARSENAKRQQPQRSIHAWTGHREVWDVDAAVDDPSF